MDIWSVYNHLDYLWSNTNLETEMKEKILVINAGSSSVRFSVFAGSEEILRGVVDQIGAKTDYAMTKYFWESNEYLENRKVKNYEEAVSLIIEILNKYEIRVDKVVHRVINGMKFTAPQVINEKVMRIMEIIAPTSPLHMISQIKIIKELMKRIKVKHIAFFDNSFHAGMPDYASTYGIPIRLSRKYDIKRFGFHGIAHRAMYNEMNAIAKKKFERMITCQIGNGVSVCAIKNGKSIDTSMGFTPLEGLMMGTRAGNVDPYLIKYLADKEGIGLNRVIEILEKESGLKGFVGESDMRIVLKKAREGDKNAKLAIEIYCYGIVKQISAYVGVLGGVDAIVLGGGISRSWIIRNKILKGLEFLGIKVDESKKSEETPQRITLGASKVPVWVIEANEETEMLRECLRIL